MFIKISRPILSSLVAISFLFLSSNSFGQETKRLDYTYANYTESQYSKQKVVVEWNSPEGLKMFNKAKLKHDFYQLAPFYQPQINPAYCGMATIVILANAFRMKTPGGVSNSALDLSVNQPENKITVMPFQGYSQLTFFNYPGIAGIKTEERVRGANTVPPFDPGVNLDDFVAMAKTFGMEGKAVHTDKALEDTEGFRKFMEDLKAALADSESVLVANFRGLLYGGITGGHISPLVALYEKHGDQRILILDVAAHKNPWTWVPAKDFYFAMNSGDKRPSGETKYRGYVVISDSKK